MARRLAPRFNLSPTQQRSAFGLRVRQGVMALTLSVMSLTFVGCQYISGAADLEVEPKTPPGMTEAGSSNQGGAGGGGSGGAGGGGSSGEMTGGKATGGTGPWDCVGEPIREPGSGKFTTSGTVSELNTGAPVPDATVSACRSMDADCVEPLATSDVTPEGMFTMEVSQDFQGYFRVQPPASFIPAIVQMTIPISTVRGSPDIVLFDTKSLNGLATVLTTAIDSTAGHAFFSISDCNGELARDISVTVSSMNAGNYSQYYLADNMIPTTQRTFTGQQGGGGFVNLTPGLKTFQVVKVGDTELRVATVGAPIKAGYTTFFQIQPHW
jgi:hypothetical protein